MKDSLNGYGLFNDVEDSFIRNYNRGQTIVNIVEDYTRKEFDKETIKSIVDDYLALIPEEDYKLVLYAAKVAYAKRMKNEMSVLQ